MIQLIFDWSDFYALLALMRQARIEVGFIYFAYLTRKTGQRREAVANQTPD